ncbi:MAG: aspartyl/asparaginyl beta-hydroxylase domain-containing protein [Gemmataceae bacterium]|nr:aspartyl/asparaginyl beta-hydroxylase domain-containing protein [Gemmataceae bacterium]
MLAVPFHWIVLGVYSLTAPYVHFRGRARFRVTRQLTDHSTLLSPLNALMYLSSTVPARAYLDPTDFPQLAPLAEHWETIRDECLALTDQGAIKAAAGHTDAGFNSFFRTGWKRFYLSWYGSPHQSAVERCPKTVALLKSIPDIHAAMFALLPPGAHLVRHRDPYAGSLRYHLGLSTPNSDACYIEVDGEKRSWRDGEVLMFDETYIHHARNDTDRDRLILFCDVRRPLNNAFARVVDRCFRRVMRAATTENVPGEKIGWLNRLFSVLYRVRKLGKAFKAKTRTGYYVFKYALLLALLYWVVR